LATFIGKHIIILVLENLEFYVAFWGLGKVWQTAVPVNLC